MEKYKKIVFLDMDGVVATPLAARAYGKKMWCVDPTIANALSRTLEKVDARIVVSSTWRLLHNNFDTFHDLLSPYNLERHLLCHSTAWRTGKARSTRGAEITDWIETYGEPEKYIILDDDLDFTTEQKEHLLHTKWGIGLTLSNLEELEERLQ